MSATLCQHNLIYGSCRKCEVEVAMLVVAVKRGSALDVSDIVRLNVWQREILSLVMASIAAASRSDAGVRIGTAF